ncbi:hypothetical protein KO481_42030 [Nocardia sp. NEAU-G5]|uniref:PPE family domain-containing protein n=1 Tax=Nocardia albiluteola TaxID=2842303 RepID=A0ABS6BFQ0_9NOCA|nr:hypothetical protein [Nocardia albiluteola]MBU3068083.1 hypothetical protein [Nocardia albiluteola]
MTPVAEPLVAPLHPTVLDALHHTPAAPLAGLPAAQVLAGMGLPALPAVPAALPVLPGAPMLPPLDPAALVRPITDLFGGFGDGRLGAGGALNPQTLLQHVMQAIETATQWAGQGISLLQTMQSAGTAAATTSAISAQGTSAEISDQALQMHTTMGMAAGTVALGYAQMAAVAAKFALTAAALGPTLITPPGQAALLATALETGAEATAVTVKTKGHLAVHSANMARCGTRVKPTCKPKLSAVQTSKLATKTPTASGSGASGSQTQLPQLLSTLQGVIGPLQTAARQVGGQLAPGIPSVAISHAKMPAAAPLFGLGGFNSPATNIAASEPLTQWQQESVVTMTTAESSEFTTMPLGGVATTAEEEMLPPLVPGAGIAPGGGRGGTAATPESLVTGRHGDELVGEAPDDVAAPVIGALATAGNPDTPFSL